MHTAARTREQAKQATEAEHNRAQLSLGGNKQGNDERVDRKINSPNEI